MQTWLITGSSRGFGKSLATEAIARGDRVVATARNADDCSDLRRLAPDRVLTLALDVQEQPSIDQAVEVVTRQWGAIDVLVNNAGIGVYGALEEIPHELVQKIFDVNVFGLLRVTRTVLPVMRAAGRGVIINFSSIAGLSGGAGRSLYCASKFAVEGLTDALAKEVGALGIHAMTVAPGPFRTEFGTQSVIKVPVQHPDYEATAGKHMKAQADRMGKQPGDPVKAAKLICDILEGPDLPSRLVLGAYAVERYERNLARRAKELAAWKARSGDTDY